MPETVHRWVASVTNSFCIIADHSSAGDGRPDVWEVEGQDGRRWFAKRNPGPKLHRREVRAYQEGWTGALGKDRAPVLGAVDSDARAIVITAIPGRPVRSLRLDSKEEQEVYFQAGLLLARLNAAKPGKSGSASSPANWDESVEKMLAGATLCLAPDDVAMVRSLTKDTPALLPRVVSHGDFMPRNWLWDQAERRLRIIDFERTCIESAVWRDLPRLGYRILRGRPDLEAAFEEGYGRTLTAEERQASSAYAALDAVSALRWGLEHHDIESVDEAHTMLRHLQAEYSGRRINKGASR
ncbi:aminoglycoside phosphotransferase family protein [Streptomyces sp. NBC_00038]|uniref:phosphotransferase n=1 Tax=Streptomyces sp. NBC_00038 TaxID=2903615 RepID=UPI0022583491|nr:aminoglycoside phosphotransferase family protein [Streptomyces sp. NBC_00038]MCX5555381.1 aminoglycoside phosphotransferase family protein [Streptomyces sp. NBC_00038]